MKNKKEFCKIIGISVADVADVGTSGVNDPGYNQKSSFPAILRKSIMKNQIEFCKIARNPVIDRCYTFEYYAQV